MSFHNFPGQVAASTCIALLIDGDNLSAGLADQILNSATGHGTPAIRRVYGDATRLQKWDTRPEFRLIHAGSGKNATDILLTVEAMSLVHERNIGTVIIASSDGDFSHLANYLREYGVQIIGIGEAKAGLRFRQACSKFIELKAAAAHSEPKPKPPMDDAAPVAVDSTTSPASISEKQFYQLVAGILNNHTRTGKWMPIDSLEASMQSDHAASLKQAGYSSWGSFLSKHTGQLEHDQQNRRVRLKQ